MRNKHFLPVFSLVFVSSLISCNGAKNWNECGTSLEVNYCLLQGQIDHNDSIERTRGVRKYLGTKGNNDDTLNENVQKPIVNNAFNVHLKDSSETVNIKIREVEHATMVSTSGATWDSITANDTTTVWLNKHSGDSWTTLDGNKKKGQSITMFVSNNDGMSMGALGSVMWPKGMPIFGYDANDNALEAVRSGKMTGTIDSNSIAQAAACHMIIRNIVDTPESERYDENGKVKDSIAFKNIKGKDPEESDPPFGYINETSLAYQDDIKGQSPRAYLSQGYAITKNKEIKNDDISDYDKLMKFFKDDGKGDVLTILERIPVFEDKIKRKDGFQPAPKKVFMTYNNQTDTYFSATMRPLFNYFQDVFNTKITDFSGNGNDETGCLDAFETAVNKEGIDAFIINMVKSSNGGAYVDKLKASKYYDKDKKKITVPVIFWNKQPTDVDGNIDTAFMNQDIFSFVCYVGIASKQGGEAEGQMVADWIQNQYRGNKY